MKPPLILAIEDGNDEELARNIAGSEEEAVIVVSDPERQIARAYGVTMWPTIVFLDAGGIVRDVRLGLIEEDELDAPGRDKEEAPAGDKEEPTVRSKSEPSRHSAKE